MNSIDRLIAEHDLIERGLALLEKAAARIMAGESVPNGFACWAPKFFREFADGCHHAKEEDVLFPLLKARGIPEEGGPIGVMLHEHDIGRDCVGRMKAAAEAEDFDGDSFAAAASEFVPLLRQHIFKENNVLFKMAEQVLSESDDADATRQFTDVEQQRDLADMYERYTAEITRWEETLT